MSLLNGSPDRSDQRRWMGPLLVLGSAFVFSLSGVLTKAIDAGSWTIVTWRGLIGAAGIAGYVQIRNRHRPIRETFRLGREGWALAAVGALASLAFVVAFKRTFVANVSVIYATIPFAAALLERLIRTEPIRPRTMIAAGVSVTGVMLVVGGSIGSPSLDGDAVALAMVVLNALYMVLIRTFASTDVVLAGGASALLLFVAGWFFTNPLDVSAGDGVLLVLFGLAFAAAVVLWTEGTKLIPAAESGLLGSTETPLAIAMAWIILAEAPPVSSLIGAVVVLAAVLTHVGQDLTGEDQAIADDNSA